MTMRKAQPSIAADGTDNANRRWHSASSVKSAATRLLRRRGKTLLCGFCASLWLISAGAQVPSRPQPAATSAAALDPALLNQYCVTCHNQRAKTAGLMLDTLDYQHIENDAATWEKVIRKIKTGMMPPAGARRPDRSVLDAFANDIEKRLDFAAARNPNPGAPALHRLNRTEYANVIRDLLAVDVRSEERRVGKESRFRGASS